MTDENVTNQSNDTETQASKAYDALFKQVMTDLFSGLKIPIKTEQEVSRKPRTIDVVITCTPGDIEKAKHSTPFDFLGKNNIMAFKSIADILTIWEYHKIRARAHFYIAENELATSETIICAVCSSEPRNVLHSSQDTVEFRKITPWHYVSNEKLPFHVIIIRKLKTELKNYPLLLFAPMRKFKEFVKHAVEHKRLKYLEYAYILHPQETREVLMMIGDIPIPEENVKFIVNDLTPERILRYIDIEDRLRGVDVEDRLRGVDPNEALQKLPDALLKSFSREDLEKFQTLLNEKIAEYEQ